MEYEKTRKLDNQALTGAGNLTIRLGLDYEAIKYMDFSLTGAIQTTFASGTPVSRQEGPLHSLIPVIRILRESDAFKAVSPHFLRMQQLYSQKAEGVRRGSAAAAAGNETTVDVKAFPYGTTTQYSTVQDSVRMFFELPWLKNEWEQRKTWFKTIGLSSASIEFQQNSYAKLLSDANTAPVTFANSTLQIETVVTEQKNIDAARGESCILQYKESIKSDSLSAQQSERRIAINQGNALAAVHLYCLDGAAGSATTASDKLPTNLLISNIKLVANSDRDLKRSTFKRLKDENKSRYGFNAAMSSNVANDDGYAVMNFVHGNLKELIDTRRGVVDSLDLIYDTNSSSVVSYTGNATVFAKIDEVTNLPK